MLEPCNGLPPFWQRHGNIKVSLMRVETEPTEHRVSSQPSTPSTIFSGCGRQASPPFNPSGMHATNRQQQLMSLCLWQDRQGGRRKDRHGTATYDSALTYRPPPDGAPIDPKPKAGKNTDAAPGHGQEVGTQQPAALFLLQKKRKALGSSILSEVFYLLQVPPGHAGALLRYSEGRKQKRAANSVWHVWQYPVWGLCAWPYQICVAIDDGSALCTLCCRRSNPSRFPDERETRLRE
ncbi:hypothetical protein B0H67DRAFT_553710 [Lasiosphaeris hirsuta]|uniref:Uncharacterized protein n=1 Tax=Lasiosphaeris hirsuta TaxID=260670 RepID=A0AA40AFZ9_9PEZI|nr:hypothetical protein B0H67DRAFT_553710 [Lasiosphaeris hirsuta]